MINTGDRIGSMWKGPHWTPYAEAIARNYVDILPWYHTVNVNLGPAPDFFTQYTEMQRHDVLIMGAHAVFVDFPNIAIQITHDESGIPWCVPNISPFAPLTALAGVNTSHPAKFPDVFFLPRGTRLRLDWFNIEPGGGNVDPATLTFIGVQLISASNGSAPAPKKVTMPDGKVIDVGSRVPIYFTTGAGIRSGQVFTFPNNTQALQYYPPISCDVEIHDASINFFFGYQSTIGGLKEKLVIAGIESGWTPSFSPFMSLYGRPGADYAQLPFCKPYLLPKGHRISHNMINTNDAAVLTNGLITIRGVRQCEY